MDSNHNKISFTAWIIAHARTYTDIPFSQEIYAQLKVLAAAQDELVPPQEALDPAVAPLFEARYKLGNKLLKQSGINRIIEIAAGFSPRGLELAQDPEIRVVQFDLPEVVSQMKKITADIIESRQLSARNIVFGSGSALNLNDLENAVEKSGSKAPLAIIAEGLLRYLNFEEKEKVAKNVLALLQKYGGVWLTPDTHNAKHFESGLGYATNQKILQHMQRDLTANYFRDNEHARKFFEDLGFAVEQHDFNEVLDLLVSPAKLAIKSEDLEATIGHRNFFVMRPK